MKFYSLFFFLALVMTTITARCSPEKTNTVSRTEIEEMTDSNAPQENSPFFIEREEARQAAAEAAADPMYRSSLLTPRHSIQEQMKNFAKQFLTIVKITPDKTILAPLQIIVEPSSFSVSETPELHVSFKITNTKKEMVFLDFQTNQRIDILVKEKNGTVITRWSEDRSFDPISGVVTINPKESVVYTEKIPTTLMKDGTTYSIQVSLVGHPEYTLTQSITPQEPALDSSDPTPQE
ncbi:MAG: BsuPI-related putative proteinase inhibitor [Chthoniobacterales bacterium]